MKREEERKYLSRACRICVPGRQRKRPRHSYTDDSSRAGKTQIFPLECILVRTRFVKARTCCRMYASCTMPETVPQNSLGPNSSAICNWKRTHRHCHSQSQQSFNLSQSDICKDIHSFTAREINSGEISAHSGSKLERPRQTFDTSTGPRLCNDDRITSFIDLHSSWGGFS